MSNHSALPGPPSGEMRYFRVETNDDHNHNQDHQSSNINNNNDTPAPFGSWVAELRQGIKETVDKLEKLDWDLIFNTSLITAFLMIVLMWLTWCFLIYPVDHLDSQFPFQLKKLIVSEFKVSQTQITGKFNLTLSMSNHGINDVYYEKAVVSVFLRHELLWTTMSEDFYLGVGDSGLFNVSMNRTSTDIADVFMPTALMRSRKMKQACEFKVRYDAMIREGVGWWYGERDHVYVTCGWVLMNFHDDKTLVGGPSQCTVRI